MEKHGLIFVNARKRKETEDMERNWDMAERTDGRLYTKNDMVKVGCNDCQGCSACCHGMGESIVLDPYDIYRMSVGLQVKMEELMA